MFGREIYPITSSPKKLDNITQEQSFMGYTNSRATIKPWEPPTNKYRYFQSKNVEEHNNTFGKGWSPGSGFITITNIPTLTTLKTISQINPSSKMIHLRLL